MACSPKLGLLSENTDQIDEWKFLVADSFDDDLFLDLLHRIQKEAPRNWKAPRIYFQPINGAMEIDRESLAHCFQLLKQYPECHLSVQMHKLLGLR